MDFTPQIMSETSAALSAALPQWGLAPATPLRLISVSENATFVAEPPGQQALVLRVHRKAYHSRAEIISELAWTDSLRQENIVSIPSLVPTRADDRLGWIRLASEPEPRPCVASVYIDGIEPKPADADLPAWFEQLGGICARLHGHGQTWTPPPGFTRKRWDFSTTIGERPIWGSWRSALGLDPLGAALIGRTVRWIGQRLQAYGETPDRFGLIHGDPRLANLLIDDEKLWLIDFDDCGFSWFGYDFASSVSFFEHEPHVPGLMQAWMAGYRRKRVWSAADEAILPILVMLRRIKLLGWVASHAEAPTAQAMGSAYTLGALGMAERLLSSGRTPFA
jgi:Ser/Thr protein kinase RdoA (MazF antagonist)